MSCAWDFIHQSQIGPCFTHGSVAVLSSLDKIPQNELGDVIALCALAYRDLLSSKDPTQLSEALIAAISEARAGHAIHYTHIRIQKARLVQNFWADYDKLHAPGPSTNYSRFCGKFKKNVYYCAEVCVWLQKTKANDRAFEEFLREILKLDSRSISQIFHFKADTIRELKRVTRRPRIRLPPYIVDVCSHYVQFWKLMRKYDSAPAPIALTTAAEPARISATYRATKETSPRPAPYIKPKNIILEDPRAIIEAMKEHFAIGPVVFDYRNDDWIHLAPSSPRPCRCGDSPCWCVDHREIQVRRK